MMRTRKACNFGILLFGALAVFLAPSGGASAEVRDKVLVVVNDEVVTQREFDREFIPIQKNYEASLKGEELENQLGEVKKSLMEHLVNSKLAVSLAKKADIKVNGEELDERINKIKAYYGAEDVFLKALEERGTNLTEFKKEIEDRMMSQKIVEKEVISKISVAPAEVNDLYEKNRAQLTAPLRVQIRGIMVRKGEGIDEAAAKGKAEALYARARKGEDFAELAKNNSEGPYAGNGGEMGFVAKGQLLPEMEEKIFAAKKGDITDVAETEIGYHFFLIEEVEEPRDLKLEEVSDFLREQLFRKKFEENIVKWFEEKKKNAYIAYK